MKDNVIVAPSDCSVVNLEKKIFEYFATSNNEKDILIDLSSVSYFEAPSLIYLASFIAERVAHKIDLKLRLPELLEQRDLLRYFRFPDLLKDLTKKNFQDLVDSRSLIYFGENPMLNKNFRQEGESLARGIINRKVYTESVPFELDSEKNNAIHKLRGDWSGAEMQSWLKMHLSNSTNKEKLIPNRIIFECVTNSVRHSGANKLIFAAIDKTHNQVTGKKRFLDISFWDNGDSIIDTLLLGIKNNESAIHEELQKDEKTKALNSTYFIKYKHGKNDFDYSFLNSDSNPKEFKNDLGLVLLSSFFPGVSRDPKGLFNWIANPDEDQDLAFKHPGMGLTTLLNAAIDLMSGQVSVRTKNYFINIKIPTNAKPLNQYNKIPIEKKYERFYQAKIEKLDSENSKFIGNMLTVRLPLRVS